MRTRRRRPRRWSWRWPGWRRGTRCRLAHLLSTLRATLLSGARIKCGFAASEGVRPILDSRRRPVLWLRTRLGLRLRLKLARRRRWPWLRLHWRPGRLRRIMLRWGLPRGLRTPGRRRLLMSAELVESWIARIDIAVDHAIVDLRIVGGPVARYVVEVHGAMNAVVVVDVIDVHHAIHHCAIHRHVGHAIVDVHIRDARVVDLHVRPRSPFPFLIVAPASVINPMIPPVSVAVQPNPNTKTGAECESEAEPVAVITAPVINNARIIGGNVNVFRTGWPDLNVVILIEQFATADSKPGCLADMQDCEAAVRIPSPRWIDSRRLARRR